MDIRDYTGVVGGLSFSHYATQAFQDVGAFRRCQTRSGEGRRAKGTTVNINNLFHILSLLHWLVVDKERINALLDVGFHLRVGDMYFEKHYWARVQKTLAWTSERASGVVLVDAAANTPPS